MYVPFIALILDFLFPKTCVGCKKNGSYLCEACVGKIAFFPHPLCPACGKYISTLGVHPSCKRKTSLDGLIALGKYEGPLQSLIKHIKYYGHFDIVSTAAHLLLPHLPQQTKQDVVITSVPMYPRKERERGYNQSELLSRAVAKQLNLPYAHLLKKVKPTRPQAELKREERLHNLHHVFIATNQRANNMAVVLIDDVTTTRTTLNECAKILKETGVKNVYGVVLAHGR